MPNVPKLLLIDGNNMCHRVYWAQQNLSYKGRAVNVLYGFFRQLISLHKQYPEHFRIIAWDRGYARRLEESQKAVEAGIIPSAYKANRDRDQEELESLFTQIEELQYGLSYVKCLQVTMEGIEADDIINSYIKTYQKFGWEFVVVSSDADFYQVLGPGVTIYDAMKKEVWSEERFCLEVGFDASLWVDAGAIMGDNSDNIHGVDGWGPVTTNKYVREHGGIDAIVTFLQAKEKRSKKEQVFLDSLEKLRLAKSLKAMDFLPQIPKPRIFKTYSPDELERYFINWGFASLLKEIPRLV